MSRIWQRRRRLVRLVVGVVPILVIGTILLGVSASATSGPTMKVSPVLLHGGQDNSHCTWNATAQASTCDVIVSEASAASGSMFWNAEDETQESGGGGTATFTPSMGTLKPGQSMRVKIVVDCGVYAFFIVGDGTPDLVAVAYECG